MTNNSKDGHIGHSANDDNCDDYSGYLDDRVKLRTISNALQVACAVSTQALVPNERLATMRRFFRLSSAFSCNDYQSS